MKYLPLIMLLPIVYPFSATSKDNEELAIEECRKVSEIVKNKEGFDVKEFCADANRSLEEWKCVHSKVKDDKPFRQAMNICFKEATKD